MKCPRIGKLFEVLRESIRTSVTGEKHARRVKQLEKGLQDYFRKQTSKFPWDKVLELYKRMMPEAAVEEADSDPFYFLLLDWSQEDDPLLAVLLLNNINVSLEDGFTGTLEEWIEEFGLDKPTAKEFEALLPPEILEDAKQHAAELVRKIPETTRKQLNETITKALEERWDVNELKRGVLKVMDNATDNRAKMIALREIQRAVEDGKKAANLAVGATEKEWIETFAAVRPRPEHIANMDDGRIPINEAFSGDGSYDAGSGNNNPYLCHCTTVYYGVNEVNVRRLLGH